MGAETLVAGYNHRFGHDGVACDAPEVASRLRVVRVGPCTVDGMRVSSTAIRRLLDAGDRTTAEHLAGHPLSEHRPAPERGNEESKTNQSDTNHGKPRL